MSTICRDGVRRITVLFMLLASPPLATAQTAEPGAPIEDQRPLTWKTSKVAVALFPAGDAYSVYVADLHRPTNTVSVGFYARTRIPETGGQRTLLSGGGRFGMLRLESVASGRTFQVSIEAGFDGLFDAQYKNDALGWDGNYGLTFTTTRPSSRLGLKLALLHISAHLGDEYEERADIQRVNYTREELALGADWRLRPRWRTYGELGLAYRMRSDGQDRVRLQGGVEYEGQPKVLGGRMAWFGATDFSSLEERGWRLDTSLQGGLVTRSNGRTYRIFAGWYDGRPPVGQFAQYSEACFLLGFKIDP